MKKMLFLSLLASLILFGCSQESTLVSPVSQSNSPGEPNWLGLPEPSQKSLSKSFITGALIEKDADGEIIINEAYKSSTGANVKVIVKIKFYAGTLNEDTFITMGIDDETGVVTFSPALEFNKPAELYVRLEGIKFPSINQSKVNFQYLVPDGTYQPVEYQSIVVDVSQGKYELSEGQVPHFSRYGFTR